MKILAVDTTSNICSTALLEDEIKIDENTINNGLTHSENLMPLVQELLERNKINLDEINLIAICVGPGSFTGIRIGIASIKAMAEVYNIPIAQVTSLEGLAKASKSNETIVSLIDARNNQVYAGVFDSKINLKQEYMADDINLILENIKKYENISFIGNGAILHKELIEKKIKNPIFNETNEQNSFFVGLCGFEKFKNNDLKDADTIFPIYLRKR